VRFRRHAETSPRTPPLASRLEAERGRILVEESREPVVVLDADGNVVAASRRARESFGELTEGAPAPAALLSATAAEVPYEVDGRRERLVYVGLAGDIGAYEELRAGFTASVSHELRTPLARVLALLETALLPGADRNALVEQARVEIGQIGELIDDVLFISELESGREVVGLGSTKAFPVLRETMDELAEQAARAGVRLAVGGEPDAELPLRPRMIRVVAKNLAENAIRYAGPGSTFELSAFWERDAVVLLGRDDGVGVSEDDVPRLFERFYRGDRARASRGTGLGLAIVKHVVTAAGGRVEAAGKRGGGLAVRAVFPTP
jgi:two-component system, OmpR family, phosphate regulon sensor histidine kinase PhoR